MSTRTEYIYGMDSGKIYWHGHDWCHSVYRRAIGIDEHCYNGKEIDAWAENVDEELHEVSTRFGELGVRIDRIRRRIRNKLCSITFSKYSIHSKRRVEVSLHRLLIVYAFRAFALSGLAALIAAFTVLPTPYNVIAGMYGMFAGFCVARDIWG